MKEHFSTRLPYMPHEVLATSADYWVLGNQGKVLFFKYLLFYYYDPELWEQGLPAFCVYGSLAEPLGEEFLYLDKKTWTVDKERRLVLALTNMGIVKGIAAMFPVAEVDG